MLPGFRLPTHIVLAPGAIGQIAAAIRSIGSTRPLLVFDEGLAATPWPGHVLGLLGGEYPSIQTFDRIEPNPRISTIDKATAEARSAQIDLVIALGGGSVIDAAKAISMLLRNDGSCLDYEGKNLFRNRPVPFVAIPTTCGTGSEVTWVSVVSDTASQRKASVKGDGMFPTLALVDADLLRTLPPHLIAQTGMDALTHALEAYVSRCANAVSDVLASRAVKLLLTHLQPCVADPEQDEHREAVMKASTLAGMAFGNADVGAVHCLSESIGGLFDHPHGLLNAQWLLPVFRYQIESVNRRLASLSETGSAGDLLDRIDRLVDALAIPPISSLDVPPESLETIARLAVGNNSNNSNPKIMTESDYAHILRSAA